MYSKTPAKPSLVLISLSDAELKNRDMQQKLLSCLQYGQEDLVMLSQLNRSRKNLMAQSRESALTKLSNYIKTNVPTLSMDYLITSLEKMSSETGLICCNHFTKMEGRYGEPCRSYIWKRIFFWLDLANISICDQSFLTVLNSLWTPPTRTETAEWVAGQWELYVLIAALCM